MSEQPVLDPLDDGTLAGFESAAIEAVSKAGEFVLSRFLGPMDVESKGRPGRDLVTDVDRASQKIVEGVMHERYPDHQLLGEEDQAEDAPNAADVVWAVDPIDGTANYVNGSMIHAVSAGILHRGVPVAGAVWTPWPSSDNGGALLHARLGGGAKWLGKEARVAEPSDEQGRPVSGRLSTLPVNARVAFRFSKGMRGHVGDVRMTGCASHEMAHVGSGIYQFGIMGAAAVWDFAAASLIVREAGGEVMFVGQDGSWEGFSGWGAPYGNDSGTFQRMRDWRGVMLAAHPKTARFLAGNVRPRRRDSLLRRWLLGRFG